MESDDMLDVLHYMFEEDMFVGSIEQIESRQKTRKLMYEEMYEQQYSYGVTTSSGSSSNSRYEERYPEDGYMTEDVEIVPFDPEEPVIKKKTKPYTPVTSFNLNSSTPFGPNIDGPVG